MRLRIIRIFVQLIFCALPYVSFSSVFTVDNTGDTDNLLTYTAADGTNSLRKCIRLSNAAAGLDTIYFNISPGPYLIVAATILPVISSPVLIDGFSQPGASSGNLLIEIDGTNQVLILGAGSAGSTVRGLVLYGGTVGILVSSSNGCKIGENHIGTNVSATAIASPVITTSGIHIFNSLNTLVGGTVGKNIISGCGQYGIRIQGTSTGTVIEGNHLGLNGAGTAIIANTFNDINIATGAHNTIIGGATAASRNLISGSSVGISMQGSTDCMIGHNFIGTDITGNIGLGNTSDGINASNGCTNLRIVNNVISNNGLSGIELLNCNYPVLKGNIVGLGADGTTALGNTYAPMAGADNGVRINGCYKVLVGGTTAADRNIISSNSSFGLNIFLSDSALIQGNYIGTDVNGLLDRGNLYDGMVLNSCLNGIIGGSTAAEGNLFSGNNQYGLVVQGSPNALIQSNYMGTDLTGNAAIPNSSDGMQLKQSSDNCSVINNVMSGNGQSGLTLFASANRAIIKGNRIGIGVDDATPLPNGGSGITISNCFKPFIGGATLTDGNIVVNSGNYGISLSDADSAIVQGNSVGVDITGMIDHGNAWGGINASNSDDVQIGGSNVGEGNIVSGNSSYGIFAGISGGSAARAAIHGNIVGLGKDLSTTIPNTSHGIYLLYCPNTAIGGALPNQRNYISYNSGAGIYIENSPYTLVKGNYIGVDGTGLLARGNFSNGITITASREVIIGGSSSTERNIISATRAGNGVSVTGVSPKNIIKGNIIGLGIDGSTSLGNWNSGVLAGFNADSVTVGGSLFMERNIISGNGLSAINGANNGITLSISDVHTILGNYVGVDSLGTSVRANMGAGVYISSGSINNNIGGIGTLEGNILSGNKNEGIFLSGSTGNKIFRNYIGTDLSGGLYLGNEKAGINLSVSGNNDNVIGGSTARRNIIAHNQNIGGSGAGVLVAAGTRNLITHNSIYCNAGNGIQLSAGQNESIVPPAITTRNTNDVGGTGISGDSIHIYRNTKTDPWCNCEGEIFIGATIVTAGTWSLVHNLGLSTIEADAITATQTTPLNSTSAFSTCTPPPPLPVTLLNFEVMKEDDQVVLYWVTANEFNNKEFEIQRSEDGVNFIAIGTIAGQGYSSSQTHYSYTDAASAGTVYYRLKQLDNDGQVTFSLVCLVIGNSEVKLYATPERELVIESFNRDETEAIIEIWNISGQQVYKKNIQIKKGFSKCKVEVSDLTAAMYIVKYSSKEQQFVRKITIE